MKAKTILFLIMMPISTFGKTQNFGWPPYLFALFNYTFGNLLFPPLHMQRSFTQSSQESTDDRSRSISTPALLSSSRSCRRNPTTVDALPSQLDIDQALNFLQSRTQNSLTSNSQTRATEIPLTKKQRLSFSKDPWLAHVGVYIKFLRLFSFSITVTALFYKFISLLPVKKYSCDIPVISVTVKLS